MKMNFTEQLAATRANLERLEALAASEPDLFEHGNLIQVAPGASSGDRGQTVARAAGARSSRRAGATETGVCGLHERITSNQPTKTKGI